VSFRDSYAGLSDEELVEPGVVADWSVKDIIAHVTSWEEEAIKHLPVILDGKTPPRYSVTYGGIDAFNARTIGLNRRLSLHEVLQQQEDTHRRLVAYIQSAPEDQLAGETRFRRRIRLDTYGHYPHHETMIRSWRARRQSG
jgi:hypothetical protein